ncbi:hypothetical protein EC5761_08535 [Escherichia coli 576-1]|nr:hypothetical protein EC5761_08535 [Escherichia coli 576-1]DAJ19271.1 MAG TPA: hypothetical protein [Phage sp. ctgku9]DAL60263.1 MAG TPA_asm: hypothetical protein [Caudoviricetes sp.]DAO77883.1 MAG TPA: hypothetical protein [Bacteriophage sp.]DAW96579.1 MAG TPA: hypothetical protein [Caudoviricetes sp.]
MCMMIQIRGFSPSPEGLSYGQKKPALGDAGGKE